MLPIKNTLTHAGRLLIQESLATGTPISFLRGEVGNGVAGENENLAEKTELIHSILTCDIYAKRFTEEGNLIISIECYNSDIPLYTKIFEIGIFAKCGTQKCMFSYLTFGDSPDVILPNEEAAERRVYDVPFIFGEGEHAQFELSPSTIVSSDMVDDGTRYADPDGIIRRPGIIPCIAEDGLLHVDIAGSARYLRDANGNLYGPESFSTGDHTHPVATSSRDGFMSRGDYTRLDTLYGVGNNTGYVNQSLRTTASPTFAGLTVNGIIDGAQFA